MFLHEQDSLRPKFEIIKGDYKYVRYENTGWNVNVIDDTKTEYGPIEDEILGIPVTSMECTFCGCKNLITAPEIPSSVTDMDGTFDRCESLTTAPKIPEGVTNMDGTFFQCYSLTTPPEIPNSVTNMESTFANCENLITAPKIPDSVTNMDWTFSRCFDLKFPPKIPNGVTSMRYTFELCTHLHDAPEIPNSVTRMYNIFDRCDFIANSHIKVDDFIDNMMSGISNDAKENFGIDITAGRIYNLMIESAEIEKSTGISFDDCFKEVLHKEVSALVIKKQTLENEYLPVSVDTILDTDDVDMREMQYSDKAPYRRDDDVEFEI